MDFGKRHSTFACNDCSFSYKCKSNFNPENCRYFKSIYGNVENYIVPKYIQEVECTFDSPYKVKTFIEYNTQLTENDILYLNKIYFKLLSEQEYTIDITL